MEEELAALKRILISLVVSSPTTMTVNSLVKDYRNMVGGALPVAKFGYRDYITFLKERCLDIFVVEGSSRDPILTPKVTQNLKHIDQMVQKQKMQPSIKHKGKRRSVPGTVNPPPNKPPQRNLICETFKGNNVHPSPITTNNYNKPSIYRETTPVYRAEPKATPIKETNVPKPVLIARTKHNGYKHGEMVSSCNINGNEEEENINNNSERTSGSLSKFFKKRLPRYSSELDIQGNDADSSSKGSNDSGAYSSSNSISRIEEMKNEIVELIRDSAEGVWFTDLMRLYKEKYGRELSLQRFGHTSLGKLVGSLQDRVAVTRPDPLGDYLLRDPAIAAAAAAGRGRVVTLPMRRSARHLSTRDLASNPDDALPGIEIEADVYPEDCMHYLERIPPADLSELASGSQLEVLVGEVYSPSHFWLQRVGPEYNLAMEDVMDRMNEHYVSDTRSLVPGAVRVGQYCAALYEKDWHRSLIVQVVDSDTVKVRHVDYGTVDTVETSVLRYLPRAYGELRAQAVRARLAACRPSARGQRWPHAAATDFLRAVRDKRLYANIVAVDHEEDIVETFLTDTSGATDVCLTRALVRLGHADPRHDSALARDESYLYPRFEALETAATPNYAEIRRLLDDGIQLDFVDAYRRHVPAPSAAAPAPPAPPALPLELVNRVPLLRHESTPPAPEEPALSPTPQFQLSQLSLSHYQPTQPSLPHSQAPLPENQATQSIEIGPTGIDKAGQPHHQTYQHQYQTNDIQYQSGEDFVSQFQKSQAQPPLSQYQKPQSQYQTPKSQYQTTQSQYQTTQSQYQTTQPQYQTTQSQYQTTQSQYQKGQDQLSQLLTPQPAHSQYRTSHPPITQTPSTQSAIFQFLAQCKATQPQSSQYRPTLSQVQSMFSIVQSQSEQSQSVQNALSQLQLVQPQSKMQTVHPSVRQSQMLHSPQRPSSQPSLPQPIQRPVHPLASQAVHSVPQSRTPQPFVLPTLPVRPRQLPTPPPARSSLTPTSVVRPSFTPAPQLDKSFQASTPRLPAPLSRSQVQVPYPTPAQQSSLTAPPGLEPPVAVPPPAPNEVRLTEAEWSVLAHLRATDPVAAEYYLTVTAWRALAARQQAPPPCIPFDSTLSGESGTTIH